MPDTANGSNAELPDEEFYALRRRKEKELPLHQAEEDKAKADVRAVLQRHQLEMEETVETYAGTCLLFPAVVPLLHVAHMCMPRAHNYFSRGGQ